MMNNKHEEYTLSNSILRTKLEYTHNPINVLSTSYKLS